MVQKFSIEEASEEYLSPMVLTDKSNCMLEKLNKNNFTCFCQNSNNFPHLKTRKIITGNFFITHTNILLPGLQIIVNSICLNHVLILCFLSFLCILHYFMQSTEYCVSSHSLKMENH